MAGYVQDTIILLGDSITQLSAVPGGLAQQLSEVYQRKLDILNRGFNGYNSRWIIPIFKHVFSKKSERTDFTPKVKLLTIWFGANDAADSAGPQYVSLEEYSQNLSTLIQLVKDPSSEWYSPETRIIVFTPPPVNSVKWGEHMKTAYGLDGPDRNSERTKTYAEAAKEVAKKEGVPVVDVFSLLWNVAGEQEKGLEKYLSDGLHLSTDGYKLVYDALIESICQNFPELHYDKLETSFPDWKDVVTVRGDYFNLLKEPLVKKH